MSTFALPALPAPLDWLIEPMEWKAAPDGSLSMFSGPQNDYFHDPATGKRTASAPFACMTLDAPSFILSAHVQLAGSATYDAGVLFVAVSDDTWAKFCLEVSPAGTPTIVSVVTRGVSDDCNSVTLAAPEVYLRVAKTGNTLAFHYSLDGSFWHMVRYFSLGELASARIGFVAQSPVGQGAHVTFSRFAYRTGELTNLRDGQ